MKSVITLLTLSVIFQGVVILPTASASELIISTTVKNKMENFDDYLAIVRSDPNQNNQINALVQSYNGVKDEAHFPLFVSYLKERAKNEGFSQQLIDQAFKNVHFVGRVIKSDKNQLEKKITLNDYLNQVLTQARINTARQLAKQHKTAIDRVVKDSNVPAEFIVSLWGMESNFGKIQGKEDIISAVSTLAYEGRREAFFTRELLAALTVLDKKYIDVDRMKGSWAGAMGQSQFMPSSLLAYGKDGDNDGQIDIWQNKNDVFASIANYLSTIGWNKNVGWGAKVQLPAHFNEKLAGLDKSQAKTVKMWRELGVKINQNAFSPSQKLWLIIVDDDKKAYLVTDNFKTLMHWNRSYYFGISVGMLADAIKAN